MAVNVREMAFRLAFEKFACVSVLVDFQVSGHFDLVVFFQLFFVVYWKLVNSNKLRSRVP